MNDEKLKILKMIEDGIITAEEGSKLLNALAESADLPTAAKKNESGNAKWLRVKVLSTENGVKTKVNVNVPVALVETGLKIGKRFDKNVEDSLKDVDLNEILEMIKNGAEGKIVEVESDNGDIVEVYVE
ncbi:SHOCT-like domain-containing protein [Acidaminobacter hydrogenoformans]|uniref:YvlB/LiaX N-terminal domain-containing protein n=1 Tax=Acidaminobacter hydrogenoformans DSM 2784 TaxID=1120920 RepID=A0A1G5S0C4_9FIRM|nr:hypothetical protein [Acidaminobacter hydrogenoformans]SCZ79832.1 hypothetical protein SAMN03080599_01956 [Acidaminobacter hydrogenoformans DSM 2784]